MFSRYWYDIFPTSQGQTLQDIYVKTGLEDAGVLFKRLYSSTLDNDVSPAVQCVYVWEGTKTARITSYDREVLARWRTVSCCCSDGPWWHQCESWFVTRLPTSLRLCWPRGEFRLFNSNIQCIRTNLDTLAHLETYTIGNFKVFSNNIRSFAQCTYLCWNSCSLTRDSCFWYTVSRNTGPFK